MACSAQLPQIQASSSGVHHGGRGGGWTECDGTMSATLNFVLLLNSSRSYGVPVEMKSVMRLQLFSRPLHWFLSVLYFIHSQFLSIPWCLCLFKHTQNTSAVQSSTFDVTKILFSAPWASANTIPVIAEPNRVVCVCPAFCMWAFDWDSAAISRAVSVPLNQAHQSEHAVLHYGTDFPQGTIFCGFSIFLCENCPYSPAPSSSPLRALKA